MSRAPDQDILDQYSTLGLRRNQLSRSAKRDQLVSIKVKGPDAEKIIEALYGPETPEPEKPEPPIGA